MSCYGHTIVGRSWADDDEDGWDAEASQAAAANFEYYPDTAVVSTVNSSSPAAADECDPTIGNENIPPPRPSTPEPTVYDENTFALGPSTPEPTAENQWQGVHPGFRPWPWQWLEFGKKGKEAYPELLCEGSNYVVGWRNVRLQRGVPKNELMLYLPSPLHSEVDFDEEEREPSLMDDVSDLELDLLAEQDLAPTPPDTLTLLPAVEHSGAEMIESDSEIQTINRAQDDEEATSIALATSLVRVVLLIKFTYEDELADQASETEDMSPASITLSPFVAAISEEQGDVPRFEKRDSVHEEPEITAAELFSEREDGMSTVSLELSVIVSTDEEPDLVKDAPLIMSTVREQDNFDPASNASQSTTAIVEESTYKNTTKEGSMDQTIPSTHASSHVATMAEEDLCRRLKTRYFHVRLFSKRKQHSSESRILQALGDSTIH
ncbi:hypothetical protein BU23DRAFT_627736 [Bimuria novae-zelandiae CBS 107.79]|uniref:Uncharacterized protein n=1 Tax=Bimuria novae-zelandiae CBS 107.79 TaxID=1447943 RepID=A0A6A5ULV0_9PLEO|nr:hypothetical protein BU23DRAFT_627736 [Bimuria novae-zelandiae CBS 107.79]